MSVRRVLESYESPVIHMIQELFGQTLRGPIALLGQMATLAPECNAQSEPDPAQANCNNIGWIRGGSLSASVQPMSMEIDGYRPEVLLGAR